MSDDKPLDDAALEAAAQIIAVYEGEPVHPWRYFISRPEHSFHAPEIVATAAAQPAVHRLVIAELLAGAGVDDIDFNQLIYNRLRDEECPAEFAQWVAPLIRKDISPILARLVAERGAARRALHDLDIDIAERIGDVTYNDDEPMDGIATAKLEMLEWVRTQIAALTPTPAP